MGMKLKVLAVFAVMAVSVSVLLNAADDKKEKEFKYLGNAQCIKCHEERDDSVSMWNDSLHAKAYEALGTDAAREFSDDPQKDPNCLKCHVTGWGKEGGFEIDMKESKRAALEGVTCESCHGASQKYMAVFAMAQKNGESPSAEELAEKGLIQPDEKVCLGCHNEESPTFKEFKFEEMIKKVAHGKLLDKKEE